MAQKSSSMVKAVGAAVALLAAAPLSAQVIETPAAFDSVGRVQTLTPSLVARLGLAAPAFPVSGVFREARLWSVSTGGHVLGVERTTGIVERYALEDDAVAALRAAVDAGLTRTGFILTEERSDIIGESARGHFIRRQVLLGWILYGPLLSSLVIDSGGESGADVASAVYLASVPASFFVVQRLSRNVQVTRAQSSLAFDGAVRGLFTGWGILYLAGGVEPDERGARFLGLGSALGGSIYAFKRGSRLTDGEAEATTTFSNLAALTGLGIFGTVADVDSASGRQLVATLLGTGIPGYALGARYARRAGFGVTAGDVRLLTLGAVLGVMTAVTPLVGGDVDAHTGFGVATLGLLSGTWVAHRTWARTYDHTRNDANLTTLGAFAGSLAGSAVIALARPGPTGTMALVTAGAIAGAALGHGVANPARAGAARPSIRDDSPSIDLSFPNAALAAAGVRGQHRLISIRF